MIEAAGGVKGTEAKSAQEGKKRRFQSVVGLVLVCVFFSLLLSVFRSKTQGYPYRYEQHYFFSYSVNYSVTDLPLILIFIYATL